MIHRRSLLTAVPLAAGALLAAPAFTSLASAEVTPKKFAVTSTSPYSNIKALQHLLTAYGIPTAADGIYGKGTISSVRTFQQRNHIALTDYAGQDTTTALVKGSNVAVKAGWPNHNTAKAVQQLLTKTGYTTPVDGTYTTQDADLVKKFQSSRKLPSTGIVDHLTWSYLFEPAIPGETPVWSQSFITAREDQWGWDLSKMTELQKKNAQFIIAVGKGHKIHERGIKLALAVSMVEGMLYNRDTPTDADSGGLFQQRPASGWGNHDQVRNKLLATKAFFGVASHTSNPGLQDFYPGYLSKSFSEAGWDVQHCREDLKIRYDECEADATTVYGRLAPSTAPYSA